MKNTVFSQFFQEYLNGIWKGSMNRFIAFLIGLAIVLISVLSIIGMLNGKIHKEDLPNICLLLVTLISPLLTVLGFSLAAKNTDLKSTTPNPNLPK